MRPLLLSVCLFFAIGTTVALAIGLVQYVNNSTANGYLLDGSAAFVIDNVNPGNGKIFAR